MSAVCDRAEGREVYDFHQDRNMEHLDLLYVSETTESVHSVSSFMIANL